MAWLAGQGHNVFGVVLSADACAAFFAENGLLPEVAAHGSFQRFNSGHVAVLAGNVFDLGAHDLAHCAACYDRAALIALPASMRQRYADDVLGKLPSGCHMLLLTLEYPQGEKDGPPFSVDAREVARLFAPHWQIALLERRDILAHESGFQAEGVTQLHTAAYRLVKATAY
jgi:thiopurine S-methyltransferase